MPSKKKHGDLKKWKHGKGGKETWEVDGYTPMEDVIELVPKGSQVFHKNHGLLSKRHLQLLERLRQKTRANKV